MEIIQEDYDQKPLLIKQGALELWGVPLIRREDLCRVRHLYSLNDFYAEMCYEKSTGQLTCICSFSNNQRLKPYLDQITLRDLDA